MTITKPSIGESLFYIMLTIATTLSKVAVFVYIWNTFLTFAPNINYLTSYAIVCLVGFCLLPLVKIEANPDQSIHTKKQIATLVAVFIMWVIFKCLELIFL